jgi:hypothetical protein
MFLTSVTSLEAQQSTNSSGAEANGSGGTSSYTVGQTLYKTSSSIDGSSSEGVQQAFKVSTITGQDISKVTLGSNAYPNPTSNTLTLTVAEVSDLTYKLYDLQGNEIKSNTIYSQATKINIEDQPSATYFLKIYKNKSELKSFKIIKY